MTGFGSRRAGGEIERVRKPVGAFPTSGRENRAHTRIPQGIIEVGKPVNIPACEKVASPIKRIIGDFDFKAPAVHHSGAVSHIGPIGRARGRHKPHAIAWP